MSLRKTSSDEKVMRYPLRYPNIARIAKIVGSSMAIPRIYQAECGCAPWSMKICLRTLSNITGIPKPLHAPKSAPKIIAAISCGRHGFM